VEFNTVFAMRRQAGAVKDSPWLISLRLPWRNGWICLPFNAMVHA